MIRGLLFRNAGPFRGEHRLDLDAKAYALTATAVANPRSSNWSGKSFLLEIVNFVLHGKWPEHRDRDVDAWISRGEKSGYAEILFEGGFSASREKKVGTPTQIRFKGPEGLASQDGAKTALEKWLALSEDDFASVAYVEQKAANRSIAMRPEARFEIVRSWLGLERAEAAENFALAEAKTAAREYSSLRSKLAGFKEMVVEVPEIDAEAAEAEILALGEKCARGVQLKRSREEEEEKTLAAERAITAEEKALATAAELRKTVEANPTLEEDQDAIAQAEGLLETMTAAWSRAKEKADTKRKVSLGLFDGRCPVAEIECPAKKKINDDRTSAKTGADVAITALKKATEEREDAKSKLAQLRLDVAAHAGERVRFGEVQRSLPDLKKAADVARAFMDEPVPEENEDFDLHALNLEIRTKRDALTEALGRKRAREELDAKIAATEERLLGAERALAVVLRSRVVLRAAQRRVSEHLVDRLVGRANASLRDVGVDLSVEAIWEREGKKLAGSCEVCGAAYPASAKVKECVSCGAERSAIVKRGLEFLPSERSGAADDLASVAVALEAGAWLLERRESPWATAMLDEPGAACDAVNRRALAMQLVRLLTRGTFRQGIVVSHSPDVVDLYPGRIEVVVERDGSRRIEVR